MQGLIVIDKPVGVTSMEVVRRVRRSAWRGLGEPKGGPIKVKCGHAGTLDPLASGVMLVCLGKATKSVDRLMDLTKVYETDIDLTAFTTTDDREGDRQEVVVATPPSVEAIQRECAAMVGSAVAQVPPVFSAIHVGGKRAYDIARRGEAVRMGPRLVRIDAIERLGYDWPRLRLRITCGKGTYIRSIARELGQRLGTGGHLASLRRMAVGSHRVEDAVGLELFTEPMRGDAGFLRGDF